MVHPIKPARFIAFRIGPDLQCLSSESVTEKVYISLEVVFHDRPGLIVIIVPIAAIFSRLVFMSQRYPLFAQGIADPIEIFLQVLESPYEIDGDSAVTICQPFKLWQKHLGPIVVLRVPVDVRRPDPICETDA